MKHICTISLFALAVYICPCPAVSASLFYSQEQLQKIDEEVQNTPRTLDTRPKHLVHLGSIVYSGPRDWSVWLQGEKWTPLTKRGDIQLVAVTPDFADVRLMLQGETRPTTVRLKPQQSVNLLTGKIIEGF